MIRQTDYICTENGINGGAEMLSNPATKIKMESFTKRDHACLQRFF